jgi:acetyl-CoA carboxylase biotin carboxyl carrier protein
MWKLRLAMASRKKVDDSSTHDEPYVAMVRGLAEVVAEHDLSELIVDTKEVKLTLRRGTGAVAHVIAPAPAHPHVQHVSPQVFASNAPHVAQPAPPAVAAAAVTAVDDKAHVVTSPFVGTFYRRPNPDSANYVALNDRVDKGAVLCIVEAMKLMNEIEADVGGVIVGVLVEDGAPVEYGQPLFRILP